MSLEQAFKSAVARVTDERGKPAILGKSDGTLYWVDPNGTTHRTRVWARIGEQNSNQAVVVDCLNASPQIDLPVRVDYKNGVLTVIGVDDRRAVEFGGGRPPGTGGAHAWLHSRLGPDPIYIEGLQYLPLGVVPSSPPDLTVMVHGGAYYDLAGDLQVFDTAVSGSTSAYVPGSGSHFVIVCLDRSDGSIVIVDGDDVAGGGDALFPEASVTADEIEAVTIDPDYWPLGVVLLAAGQTEIRAKDIVRDLRPVASSGGGGTPGGSSGQVQFNDGGAFGGFGLWNSAANQLLIGGAAAADATAVFEAHDSIADVRFNVVNDSASNPANIANVGFYLRNDAETFKPYAFWAAGSVDLTDGSEDGYATIATIRNGLVTNLAYFGPNEIYLNYNSDNIDTIIYGANNLFTARVDAGDNAFQVGIVTPGNIADFRSSGVVFNSGEADRDFRIAGNGVTNAYFYDAGNNRHGFGTGAPQRTVHIVGPSGAVASFPSSVGVSDLLLFENAGNANMALIGTSTATSLALKMYKSGGTVHDGAISYSNSTDTMIIQTAGATRFSIDGNGIITCTSTTGAFKVNSLTTTQRNALTAADSMIIYNTTTGKFQGRASGAWVDLH